MREKLCDGVQLGGKRKGGVSVTCAGGKLFITKAYRQGGERWLRDSGRMKVKEDVLECC